MMAILISLLLTARTSRTTFISTMGTAALGLHCHMGRVPTQRVASWSLTSIKMVT